MTTIDVKLKKIRRDSDNTKIIQVKSSTGTIYSVNEVIWYIEHGIVNFYVQEHTPSADVHVVLLTNGTKYIRTNADETDENNLENLPLF